jgi:prepilin-type processing-associated H-X9-DG protein
VGYNGGAYSTWSGSAILSKLESSVLMVTDIRTPWPSTSSGPVARVDLYNPSYTSFAFSTDTDGDSINDTSAVLQPYIGRYNGVDARHSNAANMLFADASVRPRSILQWVTNLNGLRGKASGILDDRYK